MTYNKFLKTHNLPNKILEMLIYFNIIKKNKDFKYIKYKIKSKMKEPDFIETIAKFFERKYNKCRSVELKCNLKNLIYELNFAKQYLEKES